MRSRRKVMAMALKWASVKCRLNLLILKFVINNAYDCEIECHYQEQAEEGKSLRRDLKAY